MIFRVPCLLLTILAAFPVAAEAAVGGSAPDAVRPPHFTAVDAAWYDLPRSPERNIAVLAAARGGSLLATEQMLRDCRYDEMFVLRPLDPPVAAWASAPDDGAPLSPAQIYGIVLANWCMRQGVFDGNRDEVQALARRCMESAPARDPILAAELAWHYGSFAPIDADRSATFLADALREGGRTLDPARIGDAGAIADLATVAVNRSHPDRALWFDRLSDAAAGGDDLVAALEQDVIGYGDRVAGKRKDSAIAYLQAAGRFADAGCPLAEADALVKVGGLALELDADEGGALRLQATKARRIYADAGIPDRLATAALQDGLLAARGGDPAAAVECFDASCKAFAGVGNRDAVLYAGLLALRTAIRIDPAGRADAVQRVIELRDRVEALDPAGERREFLRHLLGQVRSADRLSDLPIMDGGDQPSRAH